MAKSKKFEPDYCFIRTTAETALRPQESSEYIVKFRSDLIRRPDWPDEAEAKPIALLQWSLINFMEAENRGEELFDVMDTDSSDIAHLYEWIIDRKSGDYRVETGAELWGNVLYVNLLDVQSRFDVRLVAHEMIEHVLAVFGQGCALATYMRGKGDALPFVRAVEERGFIKLKGSGNVYCLSLAGVRPPLPESVPEPRR